jgi:hypothetical protein
MEKLPSSKHNKNFQVPWKMYRNEGNNFIVNTITNIWRSALRTTLFSSFSGVTHFMESVSDVDLDVFGWVCATPTV